MLTLLFLTSCASSPASDASPATDLAVLRLGVQALTQPRQPNGDIQRAEDAKTSGQVFNYALDLEDVNWLQNDDKARLRTFVTKSLDTIEASRFTCRWYELACRRRLRQLTNGN